MIQCLLDGGVVVGLTYALIVHHIGVVTAEYTVFVLLLVGAMAITYDGWGIYRSNAKFSTKARTLLLAWSAAFLVLVVLGFLTKRSDEFSRLLVGELYLTGYVGQLLSHALLRMVQERVIQAEYAEPVVIVGTGELARYLQKKILRNPWMKQAVVGFVSLRPALPGPGDGPLLGTLDDLSAVIDRYGVQTVYFAIPLDTSDVLGNTYLTLIDKRVDVHWVPDIFSLRLLNHSLREIGGLPVITLLETPLVGVRLLIKWLEDVLLSFLLLIVASPLFILIATVIKLDSSGPVFFRQMRQGWNGHKFHIWKFRTMHARSREEGAVQQAKKDDPRVTRVGRFLRRTSLDELPQLFNVLIGDMSLVGPRPHASQHDAEYARRIADYMARQKIKPGITGLAQVRGLRGETEQLGKMVLRVESDIEYINNWSLWLDLVILFRTLGALSGRNAY